MNASTLVQAGSLLLALTILAPLAGRYLVAVFAGERTLLTPVVDPIERRIYQLAGVYPNRVMTWQTYAGAFVLSMVVGMMMLAAILLAQPMLPGHDPQLQTTPLTWDLILNMVVSFGSATTWQSYGGESTLSLTSQMAGLSVQNFLAGGAGLAIGVAFIRGFARRGTDRLGNFWVDLTRAVLYVLLPLAIVVTLVLVWQGVPLNLRSHDVATTLAGQHQTIVQGPVAAFEAMKNLGTNGGGFFNANAAHPFENPTPVTNLAHLLAMLLTPAGLVFAFGRMIGNQDQGWFIYRVMITLFMVGVVVTTFAEQAGSPVLDDIQVSMALPVDGSAPGGNMEGKELRFGIGGSVLTAVTTSNASTGSYAAMHSSFTGLGVAVLLVNMMLGGIAFGGLGTGLMSMVFVVLTAVFLGSLMIGRTPEYQGKQLGPPEWKLVVLNMVLPPLVILTLTAATVSSSLGLAGLSTNGGARGLTEIVYAYTSSFANNGQNLAGLNANSQFYNVLTSVAMLAGRIGPILIALSLASAFAIGVQRKAGEGPLPTRGGQFGGLVAGVALLVNALTYAPVLALGPVFEVVAGGR